MKTTAIDRKALIERLVWNSGGASHGICTLGNSFTWQMKRTTPDLKSVVAISGPAEKYSDEELEKLVEFSDQQTAEYDEYFKFRQGANMICIDKEKEDRWLRKRLSWTMGPYYAKTLDEAMATFKRAGV